MSLAKMCAISNFGLEIGQIFDDEKLLFDESPSRAVVGVLNEEKFKKLTQKFSLKATKIGTSTRAQKFILEKSVNIDTAELKRIYFGAFKEMMR